MTTDNDTDEPRYVEIVDDGKGHPWFGFVSAAALSAGSLVLAVWGLVAAGTIESSSLIVMVWVVRAAAAAGIVVAVLGCWTFPFRRFVARLVAGAVLSAAAVAALILAFNSIHGT